MVRPRVSKRGHVASLFVIAVATLLLSAGAAVSLPREPGVLETLERAAGEVLADAGLGPSAPVQAGEELTGLFRIDPASCGGGAATGTYFRMIQPGGSPDGPFVENGDSTCADKTYTDLAPGRDGGLSTVDYQPHPDPAFDPVSGAGVNDRITMPKAFFGANFSTATNPTDPQTGSPAQKPTVVHDGSGNLSGNLSAFAAAYQRQHFNQGAPKPDGSNPGLTSGPTGTFDPATKKFTLEWRSTIVGGPFNNFTGQWHFEGTFESAARAPTEQPADPQPSPPREESPLPLPLPLGASAVSSATGVAPGPAAAGATPAGARTAAGQVAAGELRGLFRIAPASCATQGQESGSYFRMIQANGNAESGPFIQNTGTTCADRSFTDLSPGKDGGLSTTAFQPQPEPPFDAAGNGLNDKITMPKEFFGTKFHTATNETDPQTTTKTTLPVIRVDASGKLSGDLRAFAAAWQSQHFNQGAPKPDGSNPGLTSGPTGTFDPATKKFVIEWVTTIKSSSGSSPFENFTGLWHFEGTFEGPLPAGTTPASGAGGATAVAGETQTAPAGAGQAATGALAGARTGPVFPAGLGAGLVGLALVGRWAVRRSAPSRHINRQHQ